MADMKEHQFKLERVRTVLEQNQNEIDKLQRRLEHLRMERRILMNTLQVLVENSPELWNTLHES